MGTHLRLYDSGKTALGLLPEHSGLTTQIALNAPGTLICDYPVNGVNAALLDRDIAYAAVIENGVESPDWFMLDDDGDDDASDAGDARFLKLSGRGLLALLEHAQVYPKAHTPGASVDGMEPTHDFTAATPGLILKTMIDRAKARGCFPDLTYNFTATNDSAGVPWPKGYDVTYAAGTGYLVLVQAMCDNGWADIRMTGFTLELFVPDTELGEDRTGSVLLRLGQQVLEAPRKRSRRGIISHLLGIGDGKNMVEVSNAATATKYGRREGQASDGRMTTNGSLTSMATETLNQHIEAKEGFTLRLSLDAPPDEDWPHPGQDYTVGHRIAYDQRRNTNGSYEALRVRTITWAWGSVNEAPSVSVELNDLFVEAAIRLQRRVTGIVNGSVVDAPPPVDTPVLDTTTPKAPGVPAIETFKYPVGNQFYSGANVAWTPTTRNTDESDYDDHQQYLVQYRFGPADPWLAASPVTDAAWSIDGLIPGRSISVQVAAQDSSGHVSSWSVSGFVTLEADIDPPEAPSQLTATTRLGTVTLVWDGLDHAGAPMPDDYAYSEVYRSTDSGVVAPAGELVDRFDARGGSTVASGLDYDVEQFFTMVAYDTSGNVSAASVAASATTQRLVSGDVTSGAIGELELADDAVTMGKLAQQARDLIASAPHIYYEAEEPTVPQDPDIGFVDGDLWLDSNDGNKPYRYNGASWVAVQDGAIAVAQAAANNALAAANGKNTITYSIFDADADTPGVTVGDTWFKRVVGTGVVTGQWEWDGALWQPKTLDSAVIAALDVGKLTGGQIDAAHVRIGPTSVFDPGYNPAASGDGAYRVLKTPFVTGYAGAQTGSYVILTGITFGNYMCKVDLSGYNYLSSGQSDLSASTTFYAYAGTASPGDELFINHSATMNGSVLLTGIRLARHIATGKVAIILDTPTGGWQYPRFSVDSAAGSGLTEAMGQGWSGSFVTDFSPYDLITTPPLRDLNDTHGLTQAWRKTGTTTIDGGQVAADSVTTVQLAAGAATIEKLTVGSIGDDKCVNGGLEEVSTLDVTMPAGWKKSTTYVGGTFGWNTTGPIAGTRSLNLAVTSFGVADKSAAVESRDFPVKPGDVYALKVTAKDSLGTSPGFYLGLMGSTSGPGGSSGALWAVTNATVPTGAGTEYSGTVTIPAGWNYARVITMNYSPTSNAAHTVAVDQISCRPVIVSVQIGNGQVKAANIAADAITANMVNAGTLSAQITLSGRIATALTGARVQIDSAGLKAYNAAGTVTVSIDTAGSALITGTYQTATSGRRLEISTAALNNNFGEDGQHSLKWTPAALSGGWSAAGIMPVADTANGMSGSALWLQSSGQAASPFGGSTVFVGMKTISLAMVTQGNKQAMFSLWTSGTGDVTDNASLSATNISIGQFGTTNSIQGHTVIDPTAMGYFIVMDRGGLEGIALREDATSAYLRSLTTYNRTYTNAANMYITSFGTMGRSTSLERNKVNIDRTWADDADVLARVKSLTPASFYDRQNTERYAEWSALPETVRAPEVDAEFPRRILGLIAEDVEATGLTDLLTHDDDGELAGVAYDRLAVALIPWLRELDARLTALEGETLPVGA